MMNYPVMIVHSFLTPKGKHIHILNEPWKGITAPRAFCIGKCQPHTGSQRGVKNYSTDFKSRREIDSRNCADGLTVEDNVVGGNAVALA